MPEIWTADAPGKLVLIGEYAVLEGYPAVVAAVDRRARVRLEEGPTWRIDAPQIGIRDLTFTIGPTGLSRSLPPELGLVEEALQSHAKPLSKLPAFGCSLDTGELMMSGQGPKLGLGSSASVIAALTAALVGLKAEGEAERELLNELYEYDPLLFDLALKRTVRAPGGGPGFAPEVFMGKVGLGY